MIMTSQFPTAPQEQATYEGHAGRIFTPRHYAVQGELFWGSPETATKLPAGFYSPTYIQGNASLRAIKTRTDDLLRLPDPTADMLLTEFVDFWARTDEMSRRGLAAKRGLLLWGPPGSGKTSALNIMAAHMVREMGGIVLIVNSSAVTAAALQLVRAVEPDRPIILVYEDIDAMCQAGDESGLLALLDGELQVANVINVATTNYPENLDKRFTDRPGRFDRVAFVGMPLSDAREAYFRAKAPEIDDKTIVRWVNVSDGWSLAHLRELIVGHLVLGEPEHEVIERLTLMRGRSPASKDAGRGNIGFAANRQRLAVKLTQAE